MSTRRAPVNGPVDGVYGLTIPWEMHVVFTANDLSVDPEPMTEPQLLPALPVLNRVLTAQMLDGPAAARRVFNELSSEEREQFQREVAAITEAFGKAVEAMRPAIVSFGVAIERISDGLRPLAQRLEATGLVERR